MTSAARMGFPRDRMIYVTFGGAEEDMVPAGEAAVGTYVVANAVPGREFPLIADMYKTLYEDQQIGNMSNPERVGTVYYNRGVGAAVMWIEALKNAQELAGKTGQPVSGPEFRDGYEALNMTPEALEALGISGMLAPFALSCEKHDGAGLFRVMQWNGTSFDMVTDWIGAPDEALIRTLVEESAAKFAAENGITPRECP
jgi:branched-chain amino acid transport system substrate-binding protein